MLKYVAYGFLGLSVVGGAAVSLAFVDRSVGLWFNQYFSPKEEAVKREVFENTPSYNQGMIQELQNMQFEYIKASDEHKLALKGIILHRAAAFDEEKLPDDLRTFINSLKN